MAQAAPEYLTTRELADLLRIKERKVYDLAASGEVPCSRATGKLLFPRAAVEAWVASKSAGPATGPAATLPNVFLGSHDPLLDWALRESGAGLASYCDGSVDGLDRFAAGEGIATGLHLYAPDADAWNEPQVRARFGRRGVVLVEFAWRERGLIVAAALAERVQAFADLRGLRVVPRQRGAGSQALFEHLLARSGLDPDEVTLTAPARTETDTALAVSEGRADAAFGLLAPARQFRLAFAPLLRERFDLLVDRRAWFEPPWQRFVRFCATPAFVEKAAALQGYDVSGFGRVHFNGP